MYILKDYFKNNSSKKIFQLYTEFAKSYNKNFLLLENDCKKIIYLL